MLTPKLDENVKEYYDEFDSRIKMCVVPLTTNIVQPRTLKKLSWFFVRAIADMETMVVSVLLNKFASNISKM